MFRPLLDDLTDFGGKGITISDSDLVAKCIFFVYRYIHYPTKKNKTLLDLNLESLEIGKAEGILGYLNDFYEFKEKRVSKNR
jgi:hypothetical protein